MENKPIRIQRKRTKGFKLQALSPDGREVISVCRPTKFGNPYQVQPIHINPSSNYYTVVSPELCFRSPETFANKTIAASYAIQQFQEYIIKTNFIPTIQAELKGKHLACFCPLDHPCHANVLLEIANS